MVFPKIVLWGTVQQDAGAGGRRGAGARAGARAILLIQRDPVRSAMSGHAAASLSLCGSLSSSTA